MDAIRGSCRSVARERSGLFWALVCHRVVATPVLYAWRARSRCRRLWTGSRPRRASPEGRRVDADQGSGLVSGAARHPHPMRVIRKDLQHFTFRQAFLNASPERGCQYLAMHSHEGGTLRIAEGEKVDKGFRKDVIVGNVEPRLTAHFVFRV